MKRERQLDSDTFNAELYLKKLSKESTLGDLLQENNRIFKECKELDGDLQTLVYENYSKFIDASDSISGVKNSMNALDDDLASLKASMVGVNKSFEVVDSRLKLKWQEIRRLDTMEKDLNKLKYLSELPQLFKRSLLAFEQSKDLNEFKEPVKYYNDYSDILQDYKQTKFMVSLYGEIKSYVARLKTLLNKMLETELSGE